jgi:hypothetical protein
MQQVQHITLYAVQLDARILYLSLSTNFKAHLQQLLSLLRVHAPNRPSPAARSATRPAAAAACACTAPQTTHCQDTRPYPASRHTEQLPERLS